ncbi:AbrB/MazE/SpoVT family DNA-binding domain-containing protein [Haloarchaeobius amylolyticus]|uniref:AbrB/MazE/SpoVT family DNA-binding domain-containing protein n=1 Tax=Haloarchaeobius amylolyticus TaxID=1198296 RepID=UPI00226EB433|nr:AbrB/MazE/SpoVT family DNA-binding domain-containing protein [Haloarchaeobius amylolyticus]
MTDDSPKMPWSPFFMQQMQEQMQDAGEQMMGNPQELWKQFFAGNAGSSDTMSDLTAMSRGTAMFKTRVQSGGRISIPDAEREALDIGEGDIVQTIVIPVKRQERDSNE